MPTQRARSFRPTPTKCDPRGSRSRAARLVLVAIVLSVLDPGRAAASDVRVVLVAAGAETLARKLTAEGEQVGLLLLLEPTLAPGEEHALLARDRAVALLQALSADRVRLYVPETADHARYDVTLEQSPADGDGFAGRVIESVRGRLVELELIPSSTDGPAEAEPQKASTPPSVPSSSPAHGAPLVRDAGVVSTPRGGESPPMLFVLVGLEGTVAEGGLGTTPQVGFGVRVEPVERVTAAVRALLPVADHELDRPEGTADVSPSLYLGELGYGLVVGERIRLDLGAGAGLLSLVLEGEATPPRVDHRDQIAVGLYYLHAGVVVAPTPWFRLRGALLAGVSAPRPVMRFEGREVASFGRGFVGAGLDGELGWALGTSGRAP